MTGNPTWGPSGTVRRSAASVPGLRPSPAWAGSKKKTDGGSTAGTVWKCSDSAGAGQPSACVALGSEEDKLDGRIDQDFYDRKSSEWKKEQDDILLKIERQQEANRSYLDEGVKLLELVQRAVILYEKQNEQEKRRIINFMCSNSTWKDGRLYPTYRQPFDMLVEKNLAYQKKKAVLHEKNGFRPFWLLGQDSNLRPSG